MSSNLNGFSSTTRYTSRSKIGEAVMNNGGNGSTTPNTDTTIGVAGNNTDKSVEGWFATQMGVTLDNNYNIRGYNINPGDAGTDRSVNSASNIRQLTNYYVDQESTVRNGDNFNSHPVWAGISLIPENRVGVDGQVHNESVLDFVNPISKSNALLASSYITSVSLTDNSANSYVFSLGANRYTV